jgi:hypothetical protein
VGYNNRRDVIEFSAFFATSEESAGGYRMVDLETGPGAIPSPYVPTDIEGHGRM